MAKKLVRRHASERGSFRFMWEMPRHRWKECLALLESCVQKGREAAGILMHWYSAMHCLRDGEVPSEQV